MGNLCMDGHPALSHPWYWCRPYSSCHKTSLPFIFIIIVTFNATSNFKPNKFVKAPMSCEDTFQGCSHNGCLQLVFLFVCLLSIQIWPLSMEGLGGTAGGGSSLAPPPHTWPPPPNSPALVPWLIHWRNFTCKVLHSPSGWCCQMLGHLLHCTVHIHTQC